MKMGGIQKFSFCKKCKRPYPIFDPGLLSIIGWLPDELAEFTSEQDDQRELCNREHDCEILSVLVTRSLPKEKGDIFEPILFETINDAQVPVLIVKKRKQPDAPPVYECIRNKIDVPLNFPLTLLNA